MYIFSFKIYFIEIIDFNLDLSYLSLLGIYSFCFDTQGMTYPNCIDGELNLIDSLKTFYNNSYNSLFLTHIL